MKKIKFHCPHCVALLRVPTHLAGVSGPCPKCGKVITAPEEADDEALLAQEEELRRAQSAESGGSGYVKAAAGSGYRGEAQGGGTAVLDAPPVEGGGVYGEERDSGEAENSGAETTGGTVSPDSFVDGDGAPGERGEPAAVEQDATASGFADSGEETEKPPVESPGESAEPPVDEASPAAPTSEAGGVPVVPQTAPIQVKKLDDPFSAQELPPSQESGEGTGMPRIDASLGEDGEEGDSLAGRHSASQGGPIKLNLPAPGEEVAHVSPEDFTSPAVSPESGGADEGADAAGDPPEPAEEAPESGGPVSQPSAPDIPQAAAPESALVPDGHPGGLDEEDAPGAGDFGEKNSAEDDSGEKTPAGEDSPPWQVNAQSLPPSAEAGAEAVAGKELTPPPSPEAAEPPAPNRMVSPRPMADPTEEAATEDAAVSSVEADSAVPAQAESAWPSPGNGEDLPWSASAPSGGTGEGSMGALLGEKETGSLGSPPAAESGPAESGSESGSAVDSAPRTFVPLQLPPQEPAKSAAEPETDIPVPGKSSGPSPEKTRPADELDELLGGSGGSGGGRFWLVLSISVVGVLIFGGLAMALIINFLGGTKVNVGELRKEVPEETQTVSKQSASEESGDEPASGQASAGEEASAPPRDPEQDGSAQTAAAPDAGESGEDGKEDGAASSGTVTLPFDNGSVVLADDAAASSGTNGSERSEGADGTEQAGTSPGFDSRIPLETPSVAGGTGQDAGGFNFDDQADKIVADGEGAARDMVAQPRPGTEEEAIAAGSAPASAPASSDDWEKKDFPAPGEGESRLVRTREAIEAFLKAPDWEARSEMSYQGRSLRPAIEEYYKKWPYSIADRIMLQLFKIEDAGDGSDPYWVYLVSSNEEDLGFPIVVRVEEGNLKVDWEIYAEFQDRHFAKFLSGEIASPHTFRVVVEQKSDYFGADREEFAEKGDYLIFEVNPPYGGLGEYQEYAFVEKGSPLAGKLGGDVGLGDEPLAVMVSLDWKEFAHGKKHLVIEDYVTEGWFE